MFIFMLSSMSDRVDPFKNDAKFYTFRYLLNFSAFYMENNFNTN